jgi:hypothetical protein
MEDYAHRVIRQSPVAATVLSDLHDDQGVIDDPDRHPQAGPRERFSEKQE